MKQLCKFNSRTHFRSFRRPFEVSPSFLIIPIKLVWYLNWQIRRFALFSSESVFTFQFLLNQFKNFLEIQFKLKFFKAICRYRDSLDADFQHLGNRKSTKVLTKGQHSESWVIMEPPLWRTVSYGKESIERHLLRCKRRMTWKCCENGENCIRIVQKLYKIIWNR